MSRDTGPTPMMNHYDTREIRSPAEREAAQFALLPAQVAHAKTGSAGHR